MQRSGPPSCSGRRSLLAAALGPGAEAFAPGGVAAEQQRVWAAGGLRVLLLAASPVPVSPPADPTSAPSYTPEDLTLLALVAMRDEPPTARPGHAADPRRRGDRPEDHLRDDLRTVAALALQAGPRADPGTRSPGRSLDAMSDREPRRGGPDRHRLRAGHAGTQGAPGHPAGVRPVCRDGRRRDERRPVAQEGRIWGSRWSPGRR